MDWLERNGLRVILNGVAADRRQALQKKRRPTRAEDDASASIEEARSHVDTEHSEQFGLS